MKGPTNRYSANTGMVALADARDLRSVISAALIATPLDEQSLRRGVWTYVVAERDAGMAPGHVILSLTEMVDAAGIEPTAARQEITRRVILWCVEAYFGHLGGGVGDKNLASSEVPEPPAPA